MKRQSWRALLSAAFLFLGMAVAQDQEITTVSVTEHPEFGTYLTDGEGMALYLFVEDAAALATPIRAQERMDEGVRPEAAQCTGDCLENWPPLLAEQGAFTVSSEAEGQLDPQLLYVEEVDGRQQVVYNGWPLYYFANDTQAGDINGQGVGDRWFVVSPEGHAAGEVAGGGMVPADPDAEADGMDDDAMDDDAMDDDGADGAMDQDEGQEDADDDVDAAGDDDAGDADDEGNN